MGLHQVGIAAEGFHSVFSRLTLMFLGQFYFHICQKFVGATVFRLPAGLFQQKRPLVFHI